MLIIFKVIYWHSLPR